MIFTERLIVRPFLENDYKDLYEYLSLPETYQFEPGEPISLEEARKIAGERAKGTDFWAATLKNGNKKLIGHVSFIQTKPKFFLTWEIGYIFNPAFQNKGYASEMVQAIIKYAFTELGAHRIIGHCSPENIPSWKVLEKCGMKREGLLRKNFPLREDANRNPIWLDSYEYAILEEDFK
jgi:ribosomal-protein-alanine N-acetyltransferase